MSPGFGVGVGVGIGTESGGSSSNSPVEILGTEGRVFIDVLDFALGDGVAVSSWVNRFVAYPDFAELDAGCTYDLGEDAVDSNGVGVLYIADGTLTATQPTTMWVLAKRLNPGANEVLISGDNSSDYQNIYQTISMWSSFAGSAGTIGISTGGWDWFRITFEGAISEAVLNGAAPQIVNPGTKDLSGIRLFQQFNGVSNYDGLLKVFILAEGASTDQVSDVDDWMVSRSA